MNLYLQIGQIIADLRRGPAHEAEIVKLAPAFVKERQGIPEDERLERRVRIVNAAAAGTGEGVTVEYTCGTEVCVSSPLLCSFLASWLGTSEFP